MKFTKTIAPLSAVAVATAILWGSAAADDDDDYRRPWGIHAYPGVAPVIDQRYQDECGSCHMAYPPGLLPVLSWERIMSTLDNHFKENAELDEQDLMTIRNYLLNNAAGRIDYQLSNRMVRNLKNFPVRITELPYFQHEHQKIPPRLVQGNSKVRSLSNCDTCHHDATQGTFNEHEIYIPGYGRYEDD